MHIKDKPGQGHVSGDRIIQGDRVLVFDEVKGWNYDHSFEAKRVTGTDVLMPRDMSKTGNLNWFNTTTAGTNNRYRKEKLNNAVIQDGYKFYTINEAGQRIPFNPNQANRPGAYFIIPDPKVVSTTMAAVKTKRAALIESQEKEAAVTTLRQKYRVGANYGTHQEVNDALIALHNKNKENLNKFGVNTPTDERAIWQTSPVSDASIDRINQENDAIVSLMREHGYVEQNGIFTSLAELQAAKTELETKEQNANRQRALTKQTETTKPKSAEELRSEMQRTAGGRGTIADIPEYTPSTVFDSVDAAGQPQVLTRNQRRAWEIENKWAGAEAHFKAIPSQEEITPTPPPEVPESGAVSGKTAMQTKAGQAAIILSALAKAAEPEDEWVIPGGQNIVSKHFPSVA